MNTFKILNKAVKDTNLSSTGFRLLYYMINMANMNNTDNLILFNDQLSEPMNLNKRQITNITNELVKAGYVSKETVKNPRLRKPNKYTILDQK